MSSAVRRPPRSAQSRLRPPAAGSGVADAGHRRAGHGRLDREVRRRGAPRRGDRADRAPDRRCRVKKGEPIGYLHNEIAELTVDEGQLAAKNVGAEEKAEAQHELALSVVARNDRLNERESGLRLARRTSQGRGRGQGRRRHGQRGRRAASSSTKAELDLAEQTLDEHTIIAPFDGDRHRAAEEPRRERPGQRGGRRARRTSTSSAPRPTSRSSTPTGSRRARSSRSSPGSTAIAGEPLPIEQKRFRGKITFVDPQIQPIAETAVRIYAEFENPDHELRPGLKVQMTIFLSPATAAPPTAHPAVGSDPVADRPAIEPTTRRCA